MGEGGREGGREGGIVSEEGWLSEWVMEGGKEGGMTVINQTSCIHVLH